MKLWYRNYRSDYMRTQVENLLMLSEHQFGTATLIASKQLEQGRAFASLEYNNEIDLFIGGIERDREKDANTIYFPIDRGVLGLRVCLIKKHNGKFNTVKNLSDLQSSPLLFGTGTHWPDTKILMHNSLKTVLSPGYENLFTMLSRNRFDCLPRSIAEIELEHEQQQLVFPDLTIEKSLVFVYPVAEFMFVSNSNEALKKRLEYGIKKSLDDGSFIRIFNRFHESKKSRLMLAELPFRSLIFDNFV